jgi:hypothetical protein
MNSIQNDTYYTQVKIVPRTRHYQERSVPKFLKKVFSIVEGNKFNEYISWSNDGTALIIKKPTNFTDRVLPLFFKHSNFSSFIRQLNMYKFKKSKNCSYDHIYTHPMFQRGKIDLLRNIQRNTIEICNEIPMDAQPFKAEKEVDVERLIEENTTYKKIHKDLTTQVELIEQKMSLIKDEVVQLYSETQKSQANEKFLKGVLKSLTKVYGFENIAKIIENDAEVGAESPLSVIQAAGIQADCFENCSNVNNGSLYQLPESNYEEDTFLEKCSEFSSEYQTSEYFSTNDAHFSAEKNQLPCSKQVDSFDRQPLFALDFGFSLNFVENNEDCDLDVISPKLTKIDSYVIWVDELKHKEHTSEMLFSQYNRCLSGDLTMEDF